MKRLNEKMIKRILSPLVLALLFVTLCFVLIYAKYGVYYLSNDDTGIMKTFSGYSTGIPTAYHQYGSFTLGMFFKILYTIAPKLNWYTYGSILTVIVSNAVIIFSIYKNRESEKNKNRYIDLLLIGLFTMAISVYGISRITWTINAVFGAVAGTMLLLLSSVQKEKNRLIYDIGAIVLFAVSSLIRISSYKAVLPFALLAVLYKAGNEGLKNLRRNAPGCLLLMTVLLAIFTYNRIDAALKAEIFPAGTDTFEYYRGLYTDSEHIPYEGNEKFYESIGWDQEFCNMTEIWFFIDPRFNTQNLKLIAEKSREWKKTTRKNSETLSYRNEFWNSTKDNPARILMSLAVAAMLLSGIIMTVYQFVRKRSWYDWLFLTGIQLTAIAEWGWLVTGRGRFIDRAFYCAAFPALFIGIWIFSKHVGVMNEHRLLYMAIGVLAIIGIYVTGRQNLNAERAENARKLSQISVDADEIAYRHPENLYISDTTIAGGVYLFLNMDYAGCNRNRMLWGGTGVFSRPFYETIGRFGYEEFYSDNLFDENVYYMTTTMDIWNSAFMAYMKKTYGDSVNAKVTGATDSGIYIYKLEKE